MSLTDTRPAGLFQTGAEDYQERLRRERPSVRHA